MFSRYINNVYTFFIVFHINKLIKTKFINLRKPYQTSFEKNPSPTFRDVTQLAAHQRHHDALLRAAAVQQVPGRGPGTTVDRRQDPAAQRPARLMQRHRLGKE